MALIRFTDSADVSHEVDAATVSVLLQGGSELRIQCGPLSSSRAGVVVTLNRGAMVVLPLSANAVEIVRWPEAP